MTFKVHRHRKHLVKWSLILLSSPFTSKIWLNFDKILTIGIKYQCQKLEKVKPLLLFAPWTTQHCWVLDGNYTDGRIFSPTSSVFFKLNSRRGNGGQEPSIQFKIVLFTSFFNESSKLRARWKQSDKERQTTRAARKIKIRQAINFALTVMPISAVTNGEDGIGKFLVHIDYTKHLVRSWR